MPTDTLLFEIGDPEIKRLHAEFQRAGGLSSISVRRDRADRIRYCRWLGRSTDYRKHRKYLKKDPVPWENAWDSRIPTADDLITDLGDVLTNAFKRAQLKARPTDLGDLARAEAVTKVVNKYVERQRASLADEAEYMWQFGLHYGAAVWQVGWDRALSMREVEVDLDRMVRALHRLLLKSPAAAQAQPVQQAMTFLSAVQDPASEALVVALVVEKSAELAEQLFERARMEYGAEWLKNYRISEGKARKIVRELRETGRAKIPAPYMAKDEPCVTARQVGYDLVLPPETTELQRAPWITVREWLPPAEVKEAMASSGWDETWCDLVLKTAGMVTVWAQEIAQADMADDDESTSYLSSAERTDSGLVEVLTTYRRCVSKEGVPQVWCTVWSAHATATPDGKEIVGAHYALDLPRAHYPFVGYRWRKTRRAFQEAIGIAEMVGSDQEAMKSTVDKLLDRSEVELNPPWRVRNRMALRYLAGPGGQVAQNRSGDVEPMEPPKGSPALGFELIRHIEMRLSRRFGVPHPEIPPAHTTTKMQALVDRYLTSCAEMFRMYFSFIQQNASAEELQRIAEGARFPTDPDQIAGEYDFSLWFDVRDLDTDLVYKKLEALMKFAVASDQAGVMDMAVVTGIFVDAIAPEIRSTAVRDVEGGQQAVFKEVRNELTAILAGNEPMLSDASNDPAGPMKLQFAQQVMQTNPKLAQAAQSEPLTQERLKKYLQNLEQAAVQQENKKNGRLGVKAA